MIILGVDPGMKSTGYALIECVGNKCMYLRSGNIKTEPNLSTTLRLASIFIGISEILKVFMPKHVAIEKMFVNKNAASSLMLAQARGVIMCALGLYHAHTQELEPNKLKKNITGYGHSTKSQMMLMIKNLVCNVPDQITSHEVDSLALAYNLSTTLRY